MAGSRVFDGIKVVDFGWIGVGPISAKYMADHGATVIRVESASRPDGLRMAAPNKDATPGINRSQFFASFNSSKLSLGLNMAHPQARALAKRLCVEWADVVVEGFTPKAMQAWGLHYEALSKENPGLIMLSTCQLGQTGPYNMYAGYGNMAAALGGYYDFSGWPDRPPVMIYGAYTDLITPHINATLLATALIHRERTGQGMWIDNSQFESGLFTAAPALLDYTVNGRVAQRRGNRDEAGAPHGVYPCAGDERWIAIEVFTDEAWRSLCRAMGDPAWSRDPKFATFLGRKKHEDELDLLVGEWTRPREAYDLMGRLQAAGVPAGVVQKASDLHEDPQVQHRGFFVWAEHTECGPMPYDGLEFILSKTPGEVRAAPCLGEHNEYVLKEILHVSDQELGDLVVEGVIEVGEG